jgi:hypothetical protein
MDKVKDLIVATWNVRTLLVPGKLQEIAEFEMINECISKIRI